MAEQDDISSSIPMDIIETVLSRLPTKSLLRFKAVSEPWNNLISDTYFIRPHLQRSKNSNSLNLFLGVTSAAKNHSEKFSLIRFEDREFRTEAVLEAPDGWDGGGAALCSCNGVVLLTDASYRIFLLWNPSIRKTARFWFHHPYYGMWSSYGLCHDPTIEDFKIVIVSCSSYSVYSCKAKSWMKRRCSATGIRNVPGLFVDGAVYWDRMEETGFYSIDSIIYFDSRGDEMKMLRKPEDLKSTDKICLVGLNDRLCVWHNDVDESIVRIWMKEQGRDRNSWMQFMRIDNFPRPVRYWFKPVYFQENRIVIRLNGARFLVYFPCEKTFEEFEDAELLNVRLFPYVDSLLFFPLEKTLPQRKRKRSLRIED